jgi:TolB-like protein
MGRVNSSEGVMSDIFLSYSRDDQPTASRFAEGFERAGFSVWWDQTLSAGEDYDEVTEKALEEARAVVVLWSRKSVGSRWVRAEATQADRRGTLVPAMIEPCKRPIMFELKQTADLSGWNGDPNDKAWQAYLASVRRLVAKDGTRAAAPLLPLPDRPRRSFPSRLAIATSLLLVAGAGLWAFTHFRGEQVAQGSGDIPGQAPAARAATEVTLAVLPFANLSSDPEQEYFSDGLTEEILNQLAQINALRVTGRTSSFSFKGKNEDLRVIGEKLGVANLLEGSIRKDGKNLRITAQLINSKNGTHLWSKTYDREPKSVFAVQEEIAKDVARALSIKLDVGDMSRALGGTTNLAAYEKFLHAQTLLHHLGPDLHEAAQLYRDATALDPTFWRAWFGLRSALGLIRTNLYESATEANKELAVVQAHLLAAAPDSWAKQVMLAGYYFEQRKWLESEAAIKAAIATMPASEVDGRVTIGTLRHSAGRVLDSLPLYERAARIDPLTTLPSMVFQGGLTATGRLAEAQVEYERSSTLSGSHVAADLIAIHRLLMKVDENPGAIRDFVRSHPSSPAQWKPFLEKLEATPVERRMVIRKALQEAGNQDMAALNALYWFADPFGDKDSALTVLQRILALNPIGLPFLWNYSATGMRADPRFKDILRSTGLVDYFRATGNWGDFCKPVGTDDFECH